MQTDDGVQFGNLDPIAPIAPQICRILRERIVRHDLKPQQKISESEIALHYGVSRQPVREAFIRLSVEGLVVILPQRGTLVSRIDAIAVREARFIREAVEVDIVRILVETPGQADLDDLNAQIARQYESAAGDPLDFIRRDDAFHRALADMAGKAGIWQKIQGLKAQMDRVRMLALSQFPMRKLVDQHAALVAGIAAGDGARAEAALRLHLREVLNELPQIVKSNPAFFDGVADRTEERTVTIGGKETT